VSNASLPYSFVVGSCALCAGSKLIRRCSCCHRRAMSFQDVFLIVLCTPTRYLGFSWASGVVTLSGKPYPNGRNQESASEAIAAYEAVALYGDVMVSSE
jgi:hypothetical protein